MSADAPGTAVRPVQPDDDPLQLCALWRQADALHARLAPAFFRVPRGGTRSRAQLVELLGARDVGLFVAERAGALVGLALVRLHRPARDPLAVPARRGYLEELVVDRRHRGAGVGRALMEHVEAWCRGRGARQLLLTVWRGNESAAAFYDRLGYGEISRVVGKDL